MTDAQIQEAINAFKANIPTHFRYPSIQEYQFTPEDYEIIRSAIKSYPNSESLKGYGIRKFIGELARDRVNEKGDALPILYWD
jgi:hypothetical protein